jgi:hypothetical protein
MIVAAHAGKFICDEKFSTYRVASERPHPQFCYQKITLATDRSPCTEVDRASEQTRSSKLVVTIIAYLGSYMLLCTSPWSTHVAPTRVDPTLATAVHCFSLFDSSQFTPVKQLQNCSSELGYYC